MSVQVAVRVRPFNQREIDLNSQLCCEMQANRTSLKNFEDPERNKDFFFDYSFWSHDGFKTLPDGTNVPDDEYSIYADQRKVYDCLGQSVLDQAWQGYNVCMFAYGQTGAGKSYSVMGYKPNVGIVPIACREIFEKIRSLQDNSTDQYHVDFGMMEIYNERVQDLLIPIETRPPQGMKIRESKTLGFYPEGLRKCPVANFDEIERRMDEGSKNRSVASTQMNANSSRAHTIIQIELKQILTLAGRKIERVSVLNLVDLAGSEKVGKTGATGDRLKEAANINKSLSMLGIVISTLADIESGKTGKKVPYRDSCLTKLLANALGGNAKTIMICAISPAWDNYEESLSTLRYADQAKKIKNRAEVNESATDKLIRELREENQKLKLMLEGFESSMKDGKFDQNDPEMMKKFLDIQEHLMGNQKLIENQSKSDEQRRQDLQAQEETEIKGPKIDKSQPYMTNLNEDPQLNNMMEYPLINPQTHVGKIKGNPVPEIILNGLGIKPNHCHFQNEGGKLYLVPGKEETIKNYLHLNGTKVANKIELKHNDRVIIGTQGAFVIKIPNTDPREGTPAEKDLDWEFAQKELTNELDKFKKEQEENLRKQMNLSMEEKLRVLEQKHQQEIDQLENEKKKMSQQYEQQIQQIEAGNDNPVLQKSKTLEIQSKMKSALAKAQKDNEEYKEQKQKFLAQEFIQKLNAEKEKKKLEEDLASLMPKLNEMNLIADELGRDVKFVLSMGDENDSKVKVKVENKETGTKYTWDIEKALNRYYCLKDQLDDFNQTQQVNGKQNDDADPFWDPPDPNLLGKGVLKLAPIAYNMDNPEELWVLEEQTDKIRGLLRVNVIPSSSDGKQNLCDENQQINNPKKNLGKKIHIKIVIQSSKLGENVTDTYVQYNFMGQNYSTQCISGKKRNPQYNYIKVHSLKVTENDIDYFLRTQLQFKVFGIIDFKADPTFLGKKDVEQNIGEDPSQKKKMEKILAKEREKKEKEAKRKMQELKKQKEKELQDEDDLPFHKQRWFWTCVIGLLVFILYIVFLVVCGQYRSSFEDLTMIEEQLVVEDYSVNFNQWRAYNVMMLSSAVLVTLICINVIAAKCMPLQLKELAIISCIPFIIWFISSITWLAGDTGYKAFEYSKIYDNNGICANDGSIPPCKFIKNFQNLTSFTVAVLIINGIFYIGYIWTLLKWAEERKKFLEQLKQESKPDQQAQMVNESELNMNPDKNNLSYN